MYYVGIAFLVEFSQCYIFPIVYKHYYLLKLDGIGTYQSVVSLIESGAGAEFKTFDGDDES